MCTWLIDYVHPRFIPSYYLSTTGRMSCNDNIVTFDNTDTADNMVVDTDLTYPELSAHTDANGVTIAEVLPEGESLRLKDTIEEDVVSAEPTGFVQEPKQVEAVLNTEEVTEAKEPTGVDAPKRIVADVEVRPRLEEDDRTDSAMTQNGHSSPIAESKLGMFCTVLVVEPIG